MNELSMHHVGIKVESVEAAIESFASMGIPCNEVVDCPEVGLKIACLTLGNVEVEFLEVVDEKSPIARDPSGFHHIAVTTDDIEKQFKLMKNSDACEVQGTVRRGLHNNKLFFFRLKGNPGALYECVEPARVEVGSPHC